MFEKWGGGGREREKKYIKRERRENKEENREKEKTKKRDGRTCSYSRRIASASLVRVTRLSSTRRMPCMYLAKCSVGAASTGALSTEMTALTRCGDCRASVMAVLAPLGNEAYQQGGFSFFLSF